MRIRIDNFRGRNPKVAKESLDVDSAQVATDIQLGASAARSWKSTKFIQYITGTGSKTLFNFITSEREYWVASDLDLDFNLSPIPGDRWYRVYYTGESEPRVLAEDLIDNEVFDLSSDYNKLGIPGPGAAITKAYGYNTGSNYRAYFYTYNSRYGEEGIPSPIRVVNNYGSGSVILKGFSEPPANRGLLTDKSGRKPKVYIYRTNASTAGTAAFQYVGSFDVSDVVAWPSHIFTDAVTDANLGEVCPSVTWNPPDRHMRGLVSLANGSMAGFYKNQIFFSEPNLPHAWPVAYQISINDEIVALCPFGTDLVVLTEAAPYLITGNLPTAVTKLRYNGYYPCTAKEGVVLSPYGPIYPSQGGLILINQNGPKNLTEKVLEAKDWEKWAPASITGALFFDDNYFASYLSTDADNATGGFIFNVNAGEFTEISEYHYARHQVTKTGKMYVVKSIPSASPAMLGIYKWEGDPFNYFQYTWKSKQFKFNENVNFSVAQVLIDYDVYTKIVTDMATNNTKVAANTATWAVGTIGGTLNGDISGVGGELNTYEINGDKMYSDLYSLFVNGTITFKLIVDGTLQHTETITNGNTSSFKLPRGFKGKRFEIEISGYVPVERLTVATSKMEI